MRFYFDFSKFFLHFFSLSSLFSRKIPTKMGVNSVLSEKLRDFQSHILRKKTQVAQ
ncbi:hypothetical protein HMPREF9999_00710 [Alloprevotella sp. oral taxon 473 str. F0040]|nr:hypothetical protein HMPREF9999_00710 [Alloprevotella sp. oral taxon 473 str. F0040]